MTCDRLIPQILSCVLVTILSLPAFSFADDAIHAFSTGGHTVYHLRCGRIAPNGDRVLIAAALDGSVLCFTPDGRLLWKNQDGHSFPLDLDIADLDGDGCDETLVASADGALYVLDRDGQLSWRFNREPPLLQVCAITDTADGAVILAGGIEKKLYALSADGEILKSIEFPYVVRHIRSGDFLGDGRETAAVITAKNDKSRFFLQLFDPVELDPVWENPLGLSTDNPTEGTKFHVPWLAYRVAVCSLLPVDVDHDGRDEIVLTDHFDKRGVFYAYSHLGEKVMQSSTKGIRGRPYRMNLLTHVTASEADDERIVGLYGNQIIVYRLDGSIERIVDGPYSLACATYDPQSNTLFLGSSISGGDGVYALHLDHTGWADAFQSLRAVGRLADVERNMNTLANQVRDFTRPAYQRPPKETTVITGKSADEISQLFGDRKDYDNVRFVQFNLFTEDYDRETLDPPWNTKRETRHKYDWTARQIIDWAAEREKLQEPFALWAGHGNDPFYMQLTTIEGILNAAPTMAKALIFPEMERTDEAMQYAVRTHIIPIAQLCQKHGTAKLILRNKNIFWNASCYLDLWRETLLGGEYRDVFVPSMEETNGRTQAISLSGRMGLWLCGFFDHLSARAVTDNANFSRFWEWASQQNLSHLARSLTLRASLGADMFLVNIYQGDERDLATFYQMLDKGVIAVPEREDLLSVADLCLGMKAPSPSFLEHGKNGHGISLYEPDQPPAVFDRMDCYWGGAPTQDSDFSNYAMGSHNRMLNFLPTNPYGLVATVPADTDMDRHATFKSMLVTDGQAFYDEQGQAVSATDFKPRALAALNASAARLPVRVHGDAAWSVTRLDPAHIRVILIDPGYVSPKNRDVRVVVQHLQALECRDILSGEELSIERDTINLTVPAGILRIIDIRHE